MNEGGFKMPESLDELLAQMSTDEERGKATFQAVWNGTTKELRHLKVALTYLESKHWTGAGYIALVKSILDLVKDTAPVQEVIGYYEKIGDYSLLDHDAYLTGIELAEKSRDYEKADTLSAKYIRSCCTLGYWSWETSLPQKLGVARCIKIFEKAEHYHEAGHLAASQGDLTLAQEIYERGHFFAEAARLAQQRGNPHMVIEICERGIRYYEQKHTRLSEIGDNHGDLDRAAELAEIMRSAQPTTS